jgi:hypothetical protein
MLSKFTMCVNVLIIKAHAMYIPIGYNELVNEYVGFSCGWLMVYHDSWNFFIKQLFDVFVYYNNMQS